jgi:two-component system cell cycle sensor histidine kinase PleC
MLNNPIGAGRTGTLMGEYSLRLGEAVLRSRTRDAEQKARHEAEIAARVKSEFISNMSHELRTPLNTVIGFSKLLCEHDRRHLKSTEIVEYAQLIQSSADHLLSIINDILDISKIQSGRYTIDSSEVEVDEVLEAVVAAHRQSAEDAGVYLELGLVLSFS